MLSHKVEESLRQKVGTIDNPYQTHETLQTTLSLLGNKIEHCTLGLFQDASFVGTLHISEPICDGVLCVVESQLFFQMSWKRKKQTAVSHSSAESEINFSVGHKFEKGRHTVIASVGF